MQYHHPFKSLKMFKIFKNFVILYLLILSRTFAQPVDRNENNMVAQPVDRNENNMVAQPVDRNENNMETTTDTEQEVEKEILPFLKFVDFIPDGIVRGKFLGKLDMLARRSLKVDQLLKDQVCLEKEKERSDLYRVLLGIGHRVDQLEKTLSAGSDIVLGGDRDKRWIKILNLQTPIVKEFRNRLVNEGLDVNLFARSVQLICQERNERAGHADVSLPEVLQENSIPLILKMMKIPKDHNAIITLKVLVSPLTLPSTTVKSSVNPSTVPPTAPGAKSK